MKKLLSSLLLLLASVPVLAQTSPGLVYGQVPTPAQWNSYFSTKMDFLGNPLPATAGGTGVNNGANQLTLGGNLTFTGLFPSTFTVTGATTLTLPTTGTVTALGNSTTGSGSIVLATAPTVSSPALTGSPTAPTQSPGDNTTKIATTAFVTAASGVVTAPTSTIASGYNIAARTNSGTPNTKLDISANEVTLRDASNVPFRAASVAGTIDFGVVGANGIDAGTQAASTWYYGWVIAKLDGTIGVLGSLSSTAPTMPSGYVYKALITAARSDGTTHFIKYRQFGRSVFYEAGQVVVSSTTFNAEQTVTITPQIPPNAQTFRVVAGGYYLGTGTTTTTFSLRFITGIDFAVFTSAVTNTAYSSAGVQAEMPNVSQQFFWIASGGAGTTVAISAYLTGFTLPGGGQ